MILRRFLLGTMILALLSASALPPQESIEPKTPDGEVYQPRDKDERGLWMQMGEQERLIRNSNFIVRDPTINNYVRGVFCRTVGPRCSEVRIYLMRTPYFNAQIAPNGMMQIWSGLLLRIRNEAQLSAILGHEYVHYRDHHSLELFRRAKSGAAVATIFAAMGLGLIGLAAISDIFRFSRDQEAAADAGSVPLMAAAGYDPHEAPKIWEQLRAEQDQTAVARATKSLKDKRGGMFATHPPSIERVAALTRIASTMPTPVIGGVGEREYRAALIDLWEGMVDDQIKLNDFGGTEFLIAALATDGWTSRLNYARGELYRARGRAADLTAAAGFYRAAAAFPDARVECWRGLGLTLLRSGVRAEGQEALKVYLARKPGASDKAMIAMLAGE